MKTKHRIFVKLDDFPLHAYKYMQCVHTMAAEHMWHAHPAAWFHGELYENFIEESIACSPIIYICVCVCVCSWPGGRLSWLPHPTFVPVTIKTTSVIGMEALAFFSNLSRHIWEELREPLFFHYLLQQITLSFRGGMQPKYCGHLLSDPWPNLFDTQHSMCPGGLTIYMHLI